MPKVLVINPFPLDEAGVARRAAQTGHVTLDPDTELVFRPVKFSSISFMSPHDWLLMDLGCYYCADQRRTKRGWDFRSFYPKPVWRRFTPG